MGSVPSPLTLTPAAVLFDLDGTVIDSAPDLAGAANAMRLARGMPPLPYDTLRPHVGSGARGMVGAAFGVAPDDQAFDAMRVEFLDRYTTCLLDNTRVFEAMEPVLLALEARRIPWGIVTNKHQRFTTPIVNGLRLTQRSRVVICGDTTPHAKPHPAPLLEAARRMAVAPIDCIYIGDDLRDIEAARAAGMRSGAAAWGYIAHPGSVVQWGADRVLDEPSSLLKWIEIT